MCAAGQSGPGPGPRRHGQEAALPRPGVRHQGEWGILRILIVTNTFFCLFRVCQVSCRENFGNIGSELEVIRAMPFRTVTQWLKLMRSMSVNCL